VARERIDPTDLKKKRVKGSGRESKKKHKAIQKNRERVGQGKTTLLGKQNFLTKKKTTCPERKGPSLGVSKSIVKTGRKTQEKSVFGQGWGPRKWLQIEKKYIRRKNKGGQQASAKGKWVVHNSGEMVVIGGGTTAVAD